MKTILSNRIRELRQSAGLTQEQLAEKCGVSVQAVSKWECAQSYPDIELLVLLAEQFQVTVDSLLREAPPVDTAKPALTVLPDDDCLRVVQCVGRRILSQEDYDPDVKIPLLLNETSGRTVCVEIWGSAAIEGDVSGDANAGSNVNCGDVGGNANAGSSADCGDVGGNVSAGNSVDCGDVGGNVSAGNNVNCGDVGGIVITASM